MITPLIKKSLVRKSPVVNGLLVKGGSSGGWSGKPESWPDIRKNLIPNSIRLLADKRYPLGFTATVTGGYTVKIDGEVKGTYASGAQCSIPQTDWPLGDIDSLTAYGATELDGTPTPSVPVDIVCNNGVLKTRYQSGLPLGYTLLEYVHQSGTSVSLQIDGFDDATSEIYVGWKTDTASVSTNYQPVFTVWTDNQHNSWRMLTYLTNVDKYYVYGNSKTPATANDVALDTWHDLVCKSGQFIIDNTTYNTTVSSDLTVSTRTMTVGGSLLENYYKYIKIKRQGEWIANLVPAKRKSDGRAGLYDLINNRFIGSSSFAAGPEVSDQVEIYTDGTVETIEDNLSNTATAEMLLAISTFGRDMQDIINGSVDRNIGVKVLDGTENWVAHNTWYWADILPTLSGTVSARLLCTHFVNQGPTNDLSIHRDTIDSNYLQISYNAMSDASALKTWLATQYANGTPVIVLYCKTPTTDLVSPQALAGTSATVTAGSISDLQITYTNAETGYPIDYPTGAETAHIVDIYPTTEGNDITAFHCDRVAASGNEEQGVLWAHFNMSSSINLTESLGKYNTYYNALLEAVTAKNNLIKVSGIATSFYKAASLAYLPVFDCQGIEMTFYGLLWNMQGPLKNITFKNAKPNSLQYFAQGSYIQEIKGNIDFSRTVNASGAFNNATYIKKTQEFNFSTPFVGGGDAFMYNCTALEEDVNLDLRNSPSLNKFMATYTTKFKSLRVSNQAPFAGTAPQINVSYTGMDRSALVQLFNDLPTVTGGQIINITGCSGTSNLTNEDKAIAIDKGWTVTL